jgi:hypothetical protein
VATQPINIIKQPPKSPTLKAINNQPQKTMQDTKQIITQAEREIEEILAELEEQGIKIFKIQTLNGGGINLILDERTGHTR